MQLYHQKADSQGHLEEPQAFPLTAQLVEHGSLAQEETSSSSEDVYVLSVLSEVLTSAVKINGREKERNREPG